MSSIGWIENADRLICVPDACTPGGPLFLVRYRQGSVFGIDYKDRQ
jgi:hypothetical protein